MNRELLTLINKKKKNIEIGSQPIMMLSMKLKKFNFKTFERIVKENIRAAKREYYFKTFTAQKRI